MDQTLKRYWMQEDESALAQDTKRTLEQLREKVAREKNRIASRALTGIVSRAVDGDVAACDWLERRGFIQLPKADAGNTD